MNYSVTKYSLVDGAAEVLRNLISSGHWQVGERIPIEPKLAEMLNVSRSTVREAVKTLACSGLLEVRQGAGTYVLSATDPEDSLRHLKKSGLRDLFEVRCALEVEAARLAAARHSATDIANLHLVLESRGDWHNDDDKGAYVGRDFAFHNALIAASGNPALEGLYNWFSTAVSTTIASTINGDLNEPDMAAHRGIIDAIASGNPDRAEETVRNFMNSILSELEASDTGRH
jgi:DNA-binding FadR family transcriptional regulator